MCSDRVDGRSSWRQYRRWIGSGLCAGTEGATRRRVRREDLEGGRTDRSAEDTSGPVPRARVKNFTEPAQPSSVSLEPICSPHASERTTKSKRMGEGHSRTTQRPMAVDLTRSPVAGGLTGNSNQNAEGCGGARLETERDPAVSAEPLGSIGVLQAGADRRIGPVSAAPWGRQATKVGMVGDSRLAGSPLFRRCFSFGRVPCSCELPTGRRRRSARNRSRASDQQRRAIARPR